MNLMNTMNKGDIFEVYLHDGSYSHYIEMDIEGVSKDEVISLFAEYEKTEKEHVQILGFSEYTTDFSPPDIKTYFSYVRVLNLRKKRNEFEGLPSSIFVKEINPNALYRLFIDEKKNQLEIVFKNGEKMAVNLNQEDTKQLQNMIK